jgi:hypothetical protein
MTATSSTSQSTVSPTISMSSYGPLSDAGNLVNVAGTSGMCHARLLGVRAVVEADREHLPRRRDGATEQRRVERPGRFR